MENDSAFVAPEGVYSVTEEHKPLVLPAHSVSAAPAIYPTRLSSVTVRFPQSKGSTPGLAQLLGANLNKELRKEKSPRDDGVSLSSSDTPEETSYASPDVTLGSSPAQESSVQTIPLESHKLFSHPTISNKKKSNTRPKHNMRTTSSTFITRVQSVEGLSRTLQAKQGETTFLFYNTGKSFLWIELGSKSKEPLTRISFSAYPTCHDVNPITASSERIDVIIGFSTGDLIWFDPISSRYCRLNKAGSITNSPCTAIRWVPSSPTVFLVSHADGTIIVYDKEREDGTFTPQIPSTTALNPPSLCATDPAPIVSVSTSSVVEWDPLINLFVTAPPWHPAPSNGAVSAAGKSDKDRAAKNPLSHWRVSRRAVVDFVFSPDVKYVAAISEDGCLRVIDPHAEQLVDCYASYFGALTCVAWSPDGRFILTGGQDDLLTIFSPWEQRVVARCQGHSSFVSAVAFDDARCDGRTYRFGSVGEDNKLILWDFSSGALHRPKLQATHHQRVSMSSTISLAFRRGTGSTLHLPGASIGPDGSSLSLPRYHPAPSRNEVSVVQPVLIKHIECDLLTAVSFLPRALITATKSGHIKLWIRPLAMKARHMKHGHRGLSISNIHDIVA
ncbi:WD40 repeat-like protein [Hygrophoropsis aurantiaca]|uniref:WD40 repeat-like protein n=1 Tax=Hygrophoropsis aurantiaca TaxID=72124 RepID=A0ACB8A973_9AGAM|nr:WD40 repeat-like protein [Hygrophoropsis aurantiaca]